MSEQSSYTFEQHANNLSKTHRVIVSQNHVPATQDGTVPSHQMELLRKPGGPSGGLYSGAFYGEQVPTDFPEDAAQKRYAEYKANHPAEPSTVDNPSEVQGQLGPNVVTA